MNKRLARRGITQTVKDVIISPPCGEQSLAPEGFNPGVAGATKEGQNRKITLWPLLPRLTAVLPPQGREMPHGFTLIELLVVVLIIGILAAVAVPQYQKAVYKSRSVETISMLKALTKAQNVYYLANGTLAEGVNGMKKLDIVVPENQLTGWAGTDAAHPNTYMYSCTSQWGGGCIANAANKNMPMFQVTFLDISSAVTHKNFMECSTYGGKTKIAQKICESLGSVSNEGYWVIN